MSWFHKWGKPAPGTAKKVEDLHVNLTIDNREMRRIMEELRHSLLVKQTIVGFDPARPNTPAQKWWLK